MGIGDQKITSSNSRSTYDTKVIRELFEQHYTPLVLFAKGYIPDMDIDKDIVQEVFTTLIESRQIFNNVDNLKAYLYSSVKNKCLKNIRHEEVKKRYAAYIQNETAEEEESYENRILEEEVYTLLIQEIQKLPEQCRKVYLLVLEGKNNGEIAEQLHLNIETVKSHKQTGKKILYQQLKHVIPLYMLLALLEL